MFLRLTGTSLVGVHPWLEWLIPGFAPGFPNFPRCRKTVHLRHHHVHEHQVIGQVLHGVEGFAAVDHHVGVQAEFLEHAQSDLLIGHAVLGHENAAGKTGISGVSVPAFPGRLPGDDGLAGCALNSVRHDQCQGVVQLGGSHGLVQVGGKAQVRAHPVVTGPVQRGEHDQGHGPEPWICFEPSGQLPAVHLRHLEVHNTQIEKVIHVMGRSRFLQCRFPVGSPPGPHPPGRKLLHQDFQIGCIVVHHHHMQTVQVPWGHGRGAIRRLLNGEPGSEPELRTPARGTAHPHFTAHHFRQLPGNGQSKAGAFEIAGCGCVHLAELVEQHAELVLWNAHAGVPDSEAEQDIGFAVPGSAGRSLVRRDISLFHRNQYLPLLRKLQRIPDQVGQNLAQPVGVAAKKRGNPGVDEVDEFQSFLVGAKGKRGGHLVHQALQIKVQQFHAQTSGLDLGKVQDVVDQIQQGLAAGLDGFHIADLLLGQVRILQKARHSEHSVHGRTDLVAHVGQKFGFGPVGGLGLLLDLTQLLFGNFLFRYIPGHGNDQLPAVLFKRPQPDFNRESLAIPAYMDVLNGFGPVLGIGDRVESLFQILTGKMRLDVLRAHVQKLVFGQAQAFPGLSVCVHKAHGCAVNEKNAVHAAVQCHFKALNLQPGLARFRNVHENSLVDLLPVHGNYGGKKIDVFDCPKAVHDFRFCVQRAFVPDIPGEPFPIVVALFRRMQGCLMKTQKFVSVAAEQSFRGRVAADDEPLPVRPENGILVLLKEQPESAFAPDNLLLGQLTAGDVAHRHAADGRAVFRVSGGCRQMGPEVHTVRFDQPELAFLGFARLKEFLTVQVVDVLVVFEDKSGDRLVDQFVDGRVQQGGGREVRLQDQPFFAYSVISHRSHVIEVETALLL